ncbi:MAG: DUF2330 domain-containing protein [Candidatus Methylacidiphilales bacterium]
MLPPHRLLLSVLALFVLMGICAPPSAYSCARMVRHRPKELEISIGGERAVIIWDSVNKKEHFIRQARFEIDAKVPGLTTQDAAFDFIVPTPTTPELAEADASIFDTAGYAGRNRYIGERVYTYPLGPLRDASFAAAFTLLIILTGIACVNSAHITGRLFLICTISFVVYGLTLSSGGGGMRRARYIPLESIEADVKIVREQDVAGMHAVVLEAKNSQALVEWLKANKYETTPRFQQWLDPYVKASWKITAFRIIDADSADKTELSFRDTKTVHSRAVRMSFATEHPFYPYSEPAREFNELRKERTLSLAVLSNEIVGGTVEGNTGKPWQARLQYSGSSTPNDNDEADRPLQMIRTGKWLRLAGLENDPIAQRFPTHLTYFIDHSDRPANGDLTLARAVDQTPYMPVVQNAYLPDVHIFVADNFFVNAAALLLLAADVVMLMYIPAAIRAVRKFAQNYEDEACQPSLAIRYGASAVLRRKSE